MSPVNPPPLSLARGRAALVSLLLALLVLPALAPAARADTITYGAGGLSLQGTIKDYKEGKLIYENRSGETVPSSDLRDRATGKLNPALRISVASDAALTDAETALAEKRYGDAIDKYIAVLNKSQGWSASFAQDRLDSLAAKNNRPDAALAAWLRLAQQDPAAAEKSQPPLPAATSSFLNTFASRVQTAYSSAQGDTRVTLLNYLMKIHQAQKNDAAAAKDMEELNRLSLASGGTAKSGVMANLVVARARDALTKRNYKAALDLIEQNRANFLEDSQKGDALWVLASARDGLAGDTKDPKVIQELCLDYMRVVANFPANDNADDALLRTGQLLEKLGDKEGAMALYKQIVLQYKERNSVQEAQKGLLRLGNH